VFGGFIFGYQTGVVSGVKVMEAWLKEFGRPTSDLVNNPTGYYLSSSDDKIIVSILLVGTFFGALLVAPVAGAYIDPIFERCF
jgi:SP family sugar:H+ symporter-like MFS transporter